MLGHSAISENPISALSSDGGNAGLSAAIAASATLSGSIQFVSLNLVSSVQGAANLSATLVLVTINSNISASATVTAGIRFRHTLAAPLNANATLAPVASMELQFTASLAGAATVGDAIRLYMGLVPNDLAGYAYTIPYAETYRYVTTAQQAGDDLDIGSALRFTVAGTVIDLDGSPYINLADLRVTYDEKRLSFTEIATPTIGHPSFNPENLVQLELDFGSGWTTYFKGKIRSRRHVGENNNEAIQYEAVGYQALANDVTVLNTDNRPDVLFTVGTTVTSGNTTATAITKTVRSAIEDLFTLSRSSLGAASIPATIGVPGLEQFSAQLPETVQLRNTGFFAALAQLASYEPGVKPFYDDTTQKWIFPKLPEQTTLIVNVNSVNLLSAVYDQDTSDRFTAIKLFADNKSTDARTLDINGNRGFVGRQTVTLDQNWDTLLEPTWDIVRGSGSTTAGVPEDNYVWVYRRYSIPSNIAAREPGTPVRIRQRIDVDQTTRLTTTTITSVQSDGTPISTTTNYNVTQTVKQRWVPVQADIDWKRRLVYAKHPLVQTGNPFHPGDAQAAREVQLTYWPLGAFYFTYVSSVNSDGTVASTAVTLTNESYLQYIRYPESGYQGTAYDLFGIEREFIAIVDPTEVTTNTAISRLRALQDVKISADLPIDGDPIEYAINLQTKLRVTHPTQQTGLSSYGALVTGYRYEFGQRGRSTISLSTDVSGLVRT